jgi:hypothetical protein
MSDPKDRPDERGPIDERLADASEVMRAYAGGDVSMAAVQMLRALEDGYMLDLRSVGADNLVQLQTKIRQVIALREVFENVGLELPRI